MEAKNNSKENVFIQSAALNGSSLENPWLGHEDITAGGKLVLLMGPEPNKKWGADASAAASLSISKP